MKLFVISDIHGYPAALEKALVQFEKSGATQLLICGDYLNYGPRNGVHEGLDAPRTVDLLNQHAPHITGVRGNCDSEVDQMLLTFPALAPYATVLLEDGTKLFIHHGHLNDAQKAAELCPEGSVIISGHTHVTVLEKRDGRVWLNPGSISLPKGGTKAGFAVIDTADRTISLCALEDGAAYDSLTY